MKTHEKNRKIQELKKEVQELHPFLHDLLKKIPSIKHVEYTHGTAEFGADFVLTAEDKVLNNEYYISVVVKSNEITQSSIDELERQVRESVSFVKTLQNGQKKISISQVWVISSQNFSTNAKEKISEYFKGLTINFFDSQKIVELTDLYFNDYWNNISGNVSTHLSKILTTINEEDKRYCLIPNLDPSFYIEPEIIRINRKSHDYSDQERKHLIEKIDIKKSIENDRFIILEAPMGFGKSKLLRELIKYYSNNDIYEQKRILMIPFKYNELFINGIFNTDTILQKCSLCKEDFDLQTKVTFVIDGFDEMQESISVKISNIKKLETFIYSDAKYSIIIATRGLNGFTEIDTQNAKVKKYEIQSLSFKNIIHFLEELCSKLNLKDRILEDLRSAPLFKELPQSPIAAILLARLFENNADDLPSNLPELYTRYIELVLGKWDYEKGIGLLKEYEITLSILYQIAYYYIDNQCNYITFKEYNEIIDTYIQSRNITIDKSKIDFIITERSSLLNKDIDKEIVYYTHRSFIEYIYAKGKSVNSSLVIDKRVFNLSWMNIYYFYIGIKKDCEEVLDQIIKLIPNNEQEEWLQIINMSNFYLAAITTPYNFVKANLYKIFITSAKMYCEIVFNGKKSIFDKLPQLVILWWIQFIIKENYAFSYFKKAIEETTLKIDLSSEEEKIKIYSLFFVGTVGLRLGEFEPMKYLLEKYRDKLPEDITIGIKNEIKIEKTTEKSIIINQKWLDKKVKRFHRSLIEQISAKPIN